MAFRYLRTNQKQVFTLGLLGLILGLASCATSQVPDLKKPDQPSVIEVSLEDTYSGLPRESIESIRKIEAEIIEADAEIESSKPDQKDNPSHQKKLSQRPRIPLEINENVMKWIHYFTIQDGERFHRALKRGEVYKSLVEGILRKNDVPAELYYLALIESGYITHARSPAKAVGFWQFVPETGRRYGLQQDAWIDERRDIIRSTDAAAKYLRNLYTAFQSWYLAMAGYNAGEGRILGAIMRGGNRDFWDLVEKKALPLETRNYVPKFLAATLIGKHPEKYGFTDLQSEKFPEVKSIEIPGGISLKAIASRMNVSFETLQILNPHLLRSVTPRRAAKYAIWIPQKASVDTEQLQTQLASLRPVPVQISATPSSDLNRRYHLVRRGETLKSISKRYGLRASLLRQTNHLQSKVIRPGQKLLIPDAGPKSTRIVHRVKARETLASIASRYQVPIKTLKKMNRFHSNQLRVGQRLVISKGDSLSYID